MNEPLTLGIAGLGTVGAGLLRLLQSHGPRLSETLQRVFDVPYLDVAGAAPPVIRRIAIVAGAGDRTQEMSNAEAAGAQVYITGEIHSRIETEYGRAKFAEVERFAATTGMALVGVSHAASEFLAGVSRRASDSGAKWLVRRRIESTGVYTNYAVGMPSAAMSRVCCGVGVSSW